MLKETYLFLSSFPASLSGESKEGSIRSADSEERKVHLKYCLFCEVRRFSKILSSQMVLGMKI